MIEPVFQSKIPELLLFILIKNNHTILLNRFTKYNLESEDYNNL